MHLTWPEDRGFLRIRRVHIVHGTLQALQTLQRLAIAMPSLSTLVMRAGRIRFGPTAALSKILVLI
jgi:hypothetical protein